MGLLKIVFNNTGKPQGTMGKMMLKGMNGGSHATLADFGMSFLSASGVNRIAELGFGGGRNIGELLKKYPHATLDGVDHSRLSVETAKEYNKQNADRIDLRESTIADMDLPLGRYDLATAFETVYFWGDIRFCFGKVHDLLKSGGKFLIVNESDGTDDTGRKFEDIIDNMKVYTEEQLVASLKEAGFGIVEVHHHDQKPWIAILAQK